MNKTTFENKVRILADLWLNYGDDETFEDFIAYNDLGLPFAYGLDNDLIESNEKTVGFIEETFNLLLDGLEMEDTGFDTLNEILMLPEEEDTNE